MARQAPHVVQLFIVWLLGEWYLDSLFVMDSLHKYYVYCVRLAKTSTPNYIVHIHMCIYTRCTLKQSESFFPEVVFQCGTLQIIGLIQRAYYFI